METVKHIFRKPGYIDGIGLIHPIQMKHYDEFMNAANILCLNYEHFNVDEIKKELKKDDIKLLDLVILSATQNQGYLGIYNLTKTFKLILKEDVRFNETTNSFLINEKNAITRDNYDHFREIVMTQNLLFAPKVYKNKKLQEWAEKVIKARAKSAIPSDIESQISTAALLTNRNFDEIEEWSIYQFNMQFNRALKLESYKTAVQYMLAGSQDVNLEHFAEIINLFKNPYDDIFKDKNSGKLKNLNSAIKGG